MVTSSRSSPSKATRTGKSIDWRSILARVPANVARTHHGRDPKTGFDCVGLVIWAFSEAGIALPDEAYREEEIDPMLRAGVVERALAARLRDVTGNVAASLDKDGDIWILSLPKSIVHVGIQAGGVVYHMGERLHHRDADRVRAFMKKAFRS